MINKKLLSIINLVLSFVIIAGAIYAQDMFFGVVGLIALIFSIKRYKKNYNIE